MRLIKLSEDTRLRIARSDLEGGTPDDIVERLEAYLALLEEHLHGLRTLKGVPQASFAGRSQFASVLIEQTRSAIRTDIEDSTSEKNRIQALLESLTMITGWASIETLNRHSFRDACDWELIGTSVRSTSAGASMTIPEAVVEASLLRREAFFVVPKAA